MTTEYADLLFAYRYCDCNAAETRREHKHRLSNYRIYYNITKIAKYYSKKPKRGDTGALPVYLPRNEDFEDNPSTLTTPVAK